MKRIDLSCQVRAWEQKITIPTYPALPPDRNPMFLDKRVYQGSKGRIYPNPFTDRVSDRKIERDYRAVHLENEFIRLVILPEIGGRVHVALDKTNNYDFIYRQNVIKPALVGLLGPWISGGIEFNWPQHHRPTTFMPVEHAIEAGEDGSCTVWLSEHEPMNRMKGMVGLCLYPGKAIVESKVRLYNRTAFAQTFLWWVNIGIRVHDQYQAFFPPDVHYVGDHAKRAVSWYPIAKTPYYGVDYSKGVDISWYKNIPVPTSYMVLHSDYDFFGGYDHARRAGIVHVANHHIAPGKKLWTWGNAEFGYAWDRELTDADGPYIELMAGVYTDNQPDFSWLQPYESRTFEQYWYPIQEIGPVKNANRLLAVNLEECGGQWKVGICGTEELSGLKIVVTDHDQLAYETTAWVRPGRPFVSAFERRQDVSREALLLRVLDATGKELIRYRPEEPDETGLPAPATEIPAPSTIESQDELYLSGLHLEQYRHATRHSVSYWQEALRRDPVDTRCNNAIGLLFLRQGQFKSAESYFRTAIQRLTRRNPNPYDGEPFYNLGLALKFQGRPEEAYSNFYKAAWNYAWQAPAYYALACIDCQRDDPETALEHLHLSLRVNVENLKARNLKTAILRKLGREVEAVDLARDTRSLDVLDFWSQNELELLAPGPDPHDPTLFAMMRWEPRNVLDLAFDYAEAGFFGEGAALIQRFHRAVDDRVTGSPMLIYSLGFFQQKLGDAEAARKTYSSASAASPDYCFPATLEEMLVLEDALRVNPEDARAHYYLGNLLYAKKRRQEAMAHWEAACKSEPDFAIPWRNLGIAYFNVRQDSTRAFQCYERAFSLGPADSRLCYELDQLRKRTGVTVEERLSLLEQRKDLTEQRDDLTVELATLYNLTGRNEEALKILGARRFHPWEGGEGLVSGQYVFAHLALGRRLLDSADPGGALAHFEAARHYPENLGEGKHLLTPENHLDYCTGVALFECGRQEEAREAWRRAVRDSTDPSMMYYKALAFRRMRLDSAAEASIRELLDFTERQLNSSATIDYFATSLPNFLLFEDDLEKRKRVDCCFLRGLVDLFHGRTAESASQFKEALALDCNHLWAREELKRVETLLAAGCPRI